MDKHHIQRLRHADGFACPPTKRQLVCRGIPAEPLEDLVALAMLHYLSFAASDLARFAAFYGAASVGLGDVRTCWCPLRSANPLLVGSNGFAVKNR